MLLQQPHGDPEIQHYEKFQQRINKKNREQDPETHTEVKHAKALFSFQMSKPVQLVTEQCHQIIFHHRPSFESYHLLWYHHAQWRACGWNGPTCYSCEMQGSGRPFPGNNPANRLFYPPHCILRLFVLS